MSITCYCGIMGSGKTYECVSSVILPAISKGRRVVSNIDGLNENLIREYVSKKDSVDYDETGTICLCSHSDISQKNFFPVSQDDTYSFVRPGDLVCIDECYRFWGQGLKIFEEHKIFFREHRHFTNEKGLCCDVVLMTQDFSDLQRFLRNVIELRFEAKKLKALGAPRRYRLNMFEGKDRKPISYSIKDYKSEIFPLYKSYSTGQGIEDKVDSRQTVLTPRRLAFFGGFVLFLFLFGFYGFSNFFFSGKKPKNVSPRSGTPSMERPSRSGAERLPSPIVPVHTSFSKDWRISGVIRMSGSRYIVLQNKDGNLRFEHPQGFTGKGGAISGTVDGSTVTYWSGEFSDEKRSVGLGL